MGRKGEEGEGGTERDSRFLWWGCGGSMEGGGGGRKGEPGSGAGECSSNDAIRRVMRNDVTLGAGVTVLSQGQPVQGPPALPALNPSRSLSRSNSSRKLNLFPLPKIRKSSNRVSSFVSFSLFSNVLSKNRVSCLSRFSRSWVTRSIFEA